MDEALLRAILDLPHPSWLNALMIAASTVGIGGAIWGVLGALLALTREIRVGDLVRLGVALALTHIVVDLGLKPLIGRARPPVAIPGLEVMVDVPDSRSFPSGHAASSMAAALVLTRAWQRRGRAIVWVAAAIVAVARVYLGIHYPLDALAGGVVGLGCGWVALRVPLRRALPPGAAGAEDHAPPRGGRW